MALRSPHLTQLTHMQLDVHCCLLLDFQIVQAIREGSKDDLFLHYIFMENAFELPTGVGLQLQVSSSGVFTPGIKAGVRLELANVRLMHRFNDCFFSFRVGSLHTHVRHASLQGHVHHDYSLLANLYEEF